MACTNPLTPVSGERSSWATAATRSDRSRSRRARPRPERTETATPVAGPSGVVAVDPRRDQRPRCRRAAPRTARGRPVRVAQPAERRVVLQPSVRPSLLVSENTSANCAPSTFARVDAEQQLGRPVDQLDGAVAVEDHHAVGRAASTTASPVTAARHHDRRHRCTSRAERLPSGTIVARERRSRRGRAAAAVERLRLSARPWIGIADAVVGQGRDARPGAPRPRCRTATPYAGPAGRRSASCSVEQHLAGAVGGQHGQPGIPGSPDRRLDVRLDGDGAGGTGCRRWPGRSWGCRRRRRCRRAPRRRRPAASALRITVPALPGSRTSAQIATRRRAGRRTPAAGRDVDEAADRHHAGRGHRVGQRGEGAVVDVGEPGPRRGSAGSRPLGVRTDEDLDDAAVDLEGGLDGLRTVGKEEPPLGSYRAAAELACLLDAGVARGQGPAEGTPDVGQAVTLSSARGALTSSGRAALATSTSTANAAVSLTARSARILRSTSTPARCRPWMKRL